MREHPLFGPVSVCTPPSFGPPLPLPLPPPLLLLPLPLLLTVGHVDAHWKQVIDPQHHTMPAVGAAQPVAQSESTEHVATHDPPPEPPPLPLPLLLLSPPLLPPLLASPEDTLPEEALPLDPPDDVPLLDVLPLPDACEVETAPPHEISPGPARDKRTAC